MSHWNLHVTIGNKDKEIMRGGETHLLTAKLDDGTNCSSTQERGSSYGRQQQIITFTE